MKTRQSNLSGDLSSTTGRNTIAKTSEDGRGNAIPIPIDLIIEILTRLPLKSIAICRCVSKTWASILRRQDFTELFLSRSRARPKLLLACQKYGALFFYSAPQPQNPDENSSPVVASYHMKFYFDSYFSKDSDFKVSGLDHGFIGLTNQWISKKKKYSELVIFNPSTSQLLPLTRRVKAQTLFGYDPINKQVKVLSVSVSQVGIRVPNVVAEDYQVMTLGTRKLSQRIIKCGRVLRFYPREEGRCINGVLYYKAFEKSTESDLLVCFDFRSEKFSFIKLQLFLLNNGTMTNYNGKLGLLLSGNYGFINETSTSVNLWVLEDIEKQEWSEHTYVLPALWKEIVGSEVLVFVGMTRTNEIVMESLYHPPNPLCLFYFNTERNTVVRAAIQGMDVSEYDGVHIFPYHVDNVKLMAITNDNNYVLENEEKLTKVNQSQIDGVMVIKLLNQNVQIYSSNWNAYGHLYDIGTKLHTKLQAIVSFYRCRGNIGKETMFSVRC